MPHVLCWTPKPKVSFIDHRLWTRCSHLSLPHSRRLGSWQLEVSCPGHSVQPSLLCWIHLWREAYDFFLKASKCAGHGSVVECLADLWETLGYTPAPHKEKTNSLVAPGVLNSSPRARPPWARAGFMMASSPHIDSWCSVTSSQLCVYYGTQGRSLCVTLDFGCLLRVGERLPSEKNRCHLHRISCICLQMSIEGPVDC